MEKIDPRTKLRLQKLVDETTDKMENDVEQLAIQFHKAFAGDKNNNTGKTQMSHLARMGLTARRFGDVTAFVKRQTGKEGKSKRWSKPGLGDQCFGELMVNFLDGAKKQIDVKCEKEGLEEYKSTARMMLAGNCLRNLESAYLYQACMALRNQNE